MAHRISHMDTSHWIMDLAHVNCLNLTSICAGVLHAPTQILKHMQYLLMAHQLTMWETAADQNTSCRSV